MKATIVLGAALVACASIGAAGCRRGRRDRVDLRALRRRPTLEATAPIVLAAGESLTVVHEERPVDQDRRAAQWPGRRAGAGPECLPRALTQLIVEEQPSVGGVGGVRAGDAEAQAVDTRPDPWVVHAQRSGDQCVAQRGSARRVARERQRSPRCRARRLARRELRTDSLECRRAARGVAGAGGTGRRHRLPAAADYLSAIRPDPPAPAGAYARRPRSRGCRVAGRQGLHRSSALAASRVAGAEVGTLGRTARRCCRRLARRR